MQVEAPSLLSSFLAEAQNKAGLPDGGALTRGQAVSWCVWANRDARSCTPFFPFRGSPTPFSSSVRVLSCDLHLSSVRPSSDSQ